MESPPGSARWSEPGSARSSPEAEVGHRLEDLWDIQEPQLSPDEKLNSCFKSIPVSSFPAAHDSQVFEIPSDASLADAVETLSKYKIMSIPVRNVEAPEDSSWIDRYMGIVEFAGIAVWLLHQSEVAGQGNIGGVAATGTTADRLASNLGAVTLEATSKLSNDRVNEYEKLEKLVPGEATSMSGSFFESLTSSDFYKNTKVRDISGSFRWAPFLALQSSDSFLTMLLMLAKSRMKSLPVVDLGDKKIDNIITQSAVVHMLAECVGLHWFENWGIKKLSELGLPIVKPSKLVKVNEGEPVLKAFQLMREKRIGGVPVVDGSGEKAIGSISIRDVQYLLSAPEIYKDYRSITAKDFILTVRDYLQQHEESTGTPQGVITCRRDETIKDIILRLDCEQKQRIYVVGEEDKLEGVITLRDIISRLVHEPHGYFGDFFDGVVPLPENSRV